MSWPHGAVLSSRAAKSNLESQLSRLKLANVLAGDTCTPISLSDFEVYLAFFEEKHQNIQFVVWYQDYRKRFSKLTLPGRKQSHDHGSIMIESLSVPPVDLLPPTPSWPASPYSISTSYSPPPDTSATLLSSSTLTGPTWPDRDLAQSNKEECERIVATFLRPGSSKSLALDESMRTTAIRQLVVSTHPDTFLPIYEEIYRRLENDSLPMFLAQASTNINRPLQSMWYALGFIDVFVGIALAVLTCSLVPVPPQANRAWRLFAVPFFAVGVSQIYSAWRGFCSQVMRRNAVQLRAWELQNFDEEAKAYMGRTIYGQDESKQDSKGSDEALPASDPDDPIPATDELDYKYHDQHFKVSLSRATHSFRRPPVFGPEKVVEDPRVIATHRQMLREVLRLGIVAGLIFSAIIFSVP